MLRVLREVLILAALALPPALFTGYRELKLQPEAPLGPGEVKFDEAWLWGEKAIWVDSRPKQKYERRKIPSAIWLSPEEWDSQVTNFLDEWDPEKRIVVYGDRQSDTAQTVALRLREELKIPEVWVLHGGFESWERR